MERLTATKNVMKMCKNPGAKYCGLLAGVEGLGNGDERGNDDTVNTKGCCTSLFANHAMATGSTCVTWRLIHRAYVRSGSMLTENGDSIYFLSRPKLTLMVSWMLEVSLGMKSELPCVARGTFPCTNMVDRAGGFAKGTSS